MAIQLKQLAEEGEIQKDEVPEIKTIVFPCEGCVGSGVDNRVENFIDIC